MKKIFLSFLLAFLIFSSPAKSGDLDEKLHTQCLYPTIMLTSSAHSGYGTGVIVRSSKTDEGRYVNVFLTAAHVVRDTRHFKVNVFEYKDWSDLKTAKTYPAVIYDRNPESDLALGVFMSRQPMPIASINMDAKIYIGSDIFHIGCGIDNRPRLDYGKITSKNVVKDDSQWLFRTSAHTVPGDSGGPLFHKYQVVGIARSIKSWNSFPVFNMSYYVPVTCLREWSELEGGAYDFAWRPTAIPVLAFWRLDFAEDFTTTLQ